MNKWIVGVDMAKESFAVATVWQKELTHQGQSKNSPKACATFAKRMEALSRQAGAAVIQLIVEPTGGYEAQLVAQAHQRGWQVTVVNPLDVSCWAKGMGRRVKTDRQDAAILARFGAETQPEPQEPMHESAADLQGLLRRQSDLESMLRSERNRLEQVRQLPNRTPAIAHSVERHISQLEEELVILQREIRQLIAHHHPLARQVRHLLTVPAIGLKTAPHLLATCHRFWARTRGQGTAKQLVAFLGLDPAPFESGRSVFKRPTISRKGDSVMRAKLFCAALGGVRGRNPLRDFYQSLVGRGKAKKLALVACARKIVVWAWAVFTQDVPFDATRFPAHSPIAS